MNQKLADYLDDAFRMYRGSRAAEEMKQELLINLSDKFADFRRLGHSDETALRMTIDSIGDIAEMMEQIAHSIPGEPPTDTQANFSSSNLPGADFAGIKLRQANFKDSALRDANFQNMDLTNADFRDSDLVFGNVLALLGNIQRLAQPSKGNGDRATGDQQVTALATTSSLLTRK